MAESFSLAKSRKKISVLSWCSAIQMCRKGGVTCIRGDMMREMREEGGMSNEMR